MKKRTNRGRHPPHLLADRSTGLVDNPYFHTVWENTTDAMALSDPEGIVLAANRAYFQLYGLTADEVVGQSFACIFPEAARPQAIQQYKAVFTSERHLPPTAASDGDGDAPAFEATVQRGDGVVRTVESRIAFIYEGGQRVAMLSIIRDITERRQAEAAQQESEAQLRAIYDSTYEYIGLLTPEGTLLETNQASLAFAGNTRAEVVGHPLWETPWFTHTPGAPEALRQAIRRAATGEFVRYEVSLRRPSGELMTFDFSLYPIRNAQGDVVFLVPEGRDLTERKQMEAALQQAYDKLEQRVAERTAALQTSEVRLRTLASALTMAEQAERRRIAQILHEDLQQRLFGVRMLLKVVADETAGTERELAAYAEQAYGLLEDTIALARQLTVDLSPPVLKEEGLADMLQWLATQMARQHAFQVEVRAEHSFILPPEDMRVLLYQCVRELLFNVVKHAQTQQARVELSQGVDSQLVLQVRDEGRGFDVATAEARHAGGFGLFSIRERLALFGGRMTIDSAPGQGTRITLAVSVRSAQTQGTTEA